MSVELGPVPAAVQLPEGVSGPPSRGKMVAHRAESRHDGQGGEKDENGPQMIRGQRLSCYVACIHHREPPK